MVTVNTPLVIADAASIPYVVAEEAYSLVQVELERLLALLEELAPADWTQPTACTLWTVKEIAAHQAGGYASGTSYKEMIRQYSVRRKPGQLPEDATNELQVSERAEKSPAELIAELRQVGPIAAKNWAYRFQLFKKISIPHAVAGSLSMRHLMWIIHSRDTWMHRLDICRATGRPFLKTEEHDGRIAALVMRDVEIALRGKLRNESIVFDLSGTAGGVWKVGNGPTTATLQMDALDFNIFVSGRYSYEEARALASLSGDTGLIDRVCRNLLILF